MSANRDLSAYAFANHGNDAKIYNGIFDMETTIATLTAQLAEKEAELLTLRPERFDLGILADSQAESIDFLRSQLAEKSEDAARLEHLEENELSLLCHREGSPDEFFIWWTVVDRRKNKALGHPLGNVRDVIDAARKDQK